MNSTGDNELINRILEGDASGYAILVERYKDMAFTIAFRITGQREDAEEIAQDAFLKAYRSLKQFKRKSKFSTWLYRIVYNTAISKKRLQSIPLAALDEMPDALSATGQDVQPDHFNDEDDTSRMLEHILSCLSEEDKTIVTLYYLNDSSIAEIHEITGLSKTNVKVRLFRARKRLQDYVAEHSSLSYV